MIRALSTAATGMASQQMTIDTIANNLANVNSVGFKRKRINFEDLIYQTLKLPGSSSTSSNQVPTGVQMGLGCQVSATQTLFTEGVLQQTENPLDLAIEGDGFFQITLPDGTLAYTRDGSFKIDSEGNMVNSEGFFLEPSISIPSNATNISIGSDGTVTVLSSGSATPEEVGSIELARFSNPAGLINIGKNLFKETGSSGSPTTGTPGNEGLGSISQGFVEMSNVNVVQEMVDMITAQRAYEVNSKVIQSADDMMGIASNLKR